MYLAIKYILWKQIIILQPKKIYLYFFWGYLSGKQDQSSDSFKFPLTWQNMAVYRVDKRAIIFSRQITCDRSPTLWRTWMSELSLSLPFTLSPTHLHTLLHTQTHFSTICCHCLRASSAERAQRSAGLAARGPWGLSPPICPFPLRPTHCCFNRVVYLSFHPGLVVESMTLETLKARLCLEYVYLTALSLTELFFWAAQ